MQDTPGVNHANNDKKPADSKRRRLLRTLGFGGMAGGAALVIPKQWTRPVVDSVLLPAHAQATPASISAGQRGSEEYSESGSFVVPAGVTSIALILRGASGGGGGGGGAASKGGLRVNGARGSDGAAGERVQRVLAVVPGQRLSITVGRPGAGGAPGGDSPDLNGAIGAGGPGFAGGRGGPAGGDGINGGNGQAPSNVFIDSTGGGGGGGGGGGASSVNRGGTVLALARGGDGGIGGASATDALTSAGGLGGRGGDPSGAGRGGGGGGTGGQGSSSVMAGGTAAQAGAPGAPGRVSISY